MSQHQNYSMTEEMEGDNQQQKPSWKPDLAALTHEPALGRRRWDNQDFSQLCLQSWRQESLEYIKSLLKNPQRVSAAE